MEKQKFEILSNQYIPRNAKTSPNGLPLCSTYYYIVNEKGQTINKHTLKPYRGKDLSMYWFHSIESAENFLKENLVD